ncbi:hypothetical protein [Kitasatospora sp. NPDC059327]|uniref:hypothetical protein n=1 Tax=Kitasatospora sp. NPDC059327 TaxID=3346803 RepID=UPI0036C8CB12
MADQPIEPTVVQLSGERTDGATPPPKPPTPPASAAPDFLPPPRRETPPPPAASPPPPPNPPASGAPDLPDPHEWWRRPGSGGGGGVATAPAPTPVYAPATPVTYVTNNHYYPAAPAEPALPARFSPARLRPAWNGTAAVAGLLLVPVTAHLDSDLYVVVYLAAGLAAIGELVAVMKRQRSGWLVRLLSCHVVWISVLTPVGLHAIGQIFTGV